MDTPILPMGENPEQEPSRGRLTFHGVPAVVMSSKTMTSPNSTSILTQSLNDDSRPCHTIATSSLSSGRRESSCVGPPRFVGHNDNYIFESSLNAYMRAQEAGSAQLADPVSAFSDTSGIKYRSFRSLRRSFQMKKESVTSALCFPVCSSKREEKAGRPKLPSEWSNSNFPASGSKQDNPENWEEKAGRFMLPSKWLDDKLNAASTAAPGHNVFDENEGSASPEARVRVKKASLRERLTWRRKLPIAPVLEVPLSPVNDPRNPIRIVDVEDIPAPSHSTVPDMLPPMWQRCENYVRPEHRSSLLGSSSSHGGPVRESLEVEQDLVPKPLVVQKKVPVISTTPLSIAAVVKEHVPLTRELPDMQEEEQDNKDQNSTSELETLISVIEALGDVASDQPAKTSPCRESKKGLGARIQEFKFFPLEEAPELYLYLEGCVRLCCRNYSSAWSDMQRLIGLVDEAFNIAQDAKAKTVSVPEWLVKHHVPFLIANTEIAKKRCEDWRQSVEQLRHCLNYDWTSFENRMGSTGPFEYVDEYRLSTLSEIHQELLGDRAVEDGCLELIGLHRLRIVDSTDDESNTHQDSNKIASRVNAIWHPPAAARYTGLSMEQVEERFPTLKPNRRVSRTAKSMSLLPSRMKAIQKHVRPMNGKTSPPAHRVRDLATANLPTFPSLERKKQMRQRRLDLPEERTSKSSAKERLDAIQTPLAIRSQNEVRISPPRDSPPASRPSLPAPKVPEPEKRKSTSKNTFSSRKGSAPKYTCHPKAAMITKSAALAPASPIPKIHHRSVPARTVLSVGQSSRSRYRPCSFRPSNLQDSTKKCSSVEGAVSFRDPAVYPLRGPLPALPRSASPPLRTSTTAGSQLPVLCQLSSSGSEQVAVQPSQPRRRIDSAQPSTSPEPILPQGELLRKGQGISSDLSRATKDSATQTEPGAWPRRSSPEPKKLQHLCITLNDPPSPYTPEAQLTRTPRPLAISQVPGPTGSQRIASPCPFSSNVAKTMEWRYRFSVSRDRGAVPSSNPRTAPGSTTSMGEDEASGVLGQASASSETRPHQDRDDGLHAQIDSNLEQTSDPVDEADSLQVHIGNLTMNSPASRAQEEEHLRQEVRRSSAVDTKVQRETDEEGNERTWKNL